VTYCEGGAQSLCCGGRDLAARLGDILWEAGSALAKTLWVPS